MPKITALPELTTLADEDVLPIVDDSTGSTKKVTVKNLRTYATPIGVMQDFAGSTAPDGWLLCYGQAVSRTTYADLFTVISTAFGVGDGSTTFNLPDMRGRVSAGQDDMGGTSANRLTGASGGVDGDTFAAAGGAETHTLSTAEIPSHKHSMGEVSTTKTRNYTVLGTDSGVAAAVDTGFTGGGGAHNNVQPTIILNKIIKY